jgi:hypothetical protein
MLVLRAFDVASNMHRVCGDKLFGKPTPFIRKLFMKFLNLNPNYTRIDVSLVDGKAYPYEKEVLVNFTQIAI